VQPGLAGIVPVVGRDVAVDRNPAAVLVGIAVVARVVHSRERRVAVDTSPVPERYCVRMCSRHGRQSAPELLHVTSHFAPRFPSARL